MSPRGLGRLVPVLVALALLAAACTSGGSGTVATGSPSPSPDETEPSIVGGTEAPELFGADDEVLRIATSEPSTLDPMRIGDPGSVLVARQLFEGLTRWDPIEERVVPAVAERWSVSDGGRQFTFELRPGTTFHDGSPVTSQDFRFAFDRIAQKRNASDLAYTLEQVEGFVEVNELGDARRLRGISTPDELTLVIRLAEPFQDLPSVLTHPGLVPVPQDEVADYNRFLREPVGNGPFRIAEPWTGGEVALEAFPGFIDTPEVDGLRFVPFPDAAASWIPFLQGDIDIAEVPAGQLEAAAEEFGDDGFHPFLAGYYYGLNVDSRQVGNLRVRRAISFAIDREAIAENIYKGTLQPARGIVPAGMPGFFENVCVGTCDYEPKRAQRIVDRLPPRARRVTLSFNRGSPHREVARAIRRDLRTVGFRVGLKSYRFSRYLKLLRDGNQSAYRLGWISEYPSPDVFLWSLFHSSSPDNHSGFASNRVDRVLENARAEPSENKRTQLYITAEKLILERLPIVPVGSFVTHWAAQDDVVDLTFDIMGGFDAIDISLSEDGDA